MTTLLAALVGLSHAAQCETQPVCGCVGPPNNFLSYRINVNDFSANALTELEGAADSWNAGGFDVNRGALWQYHRGADLTTDGTLTDGTNNIRQKGQSWFDSRAMSDANAIMSNKIVLCTFIEANITFRDPVLLTTASASDADDPYRSISSIAQHEFGHMLGLAHETSRISMMNEAYPSADLSETKWRIGEDDVEGLQLTNPHSSTGRNLMLQRFSIDFAASPNQQREVWSDDDGQESGQDWYAFPGDQIASGGVGISNGGPLPGGPRGIYAHIAGTATNVNTPIEWRLSDSEDCFDGVGAEYVVGTRSPTMSSNQAYYIDGPNGGFDIPNNIPIGDYYLCAMIDPDDVVSETSEDDNIIVSEKLFEIQ